MVRIFALSLGMLFALRAAAQAPPGQPEEGPGGSAYPHAAVRASGPFGGAGRSYQLFEPSRPRPAQAPVIVFLHGYGEGDSRAYRGWIDHLVRRGNTVIFPAYQKRRSDASAFTSHAADAVRDALHRLSTQRGRVRPDPDRFALVGYSLGASLAVNLASLGPEAGLPAARGLFLANAGDVDNDGSGRAGILTSPSDLPDLPLVAMAGADDVLVGDRVSRLIIEEASGVDVSNRVLMILPSDFHGVPALRADHAAPLASAGKGRGATPPDALDFFGYWKAADLLLEAAFQPGGGGLHATEDWRFLGTWSDGQAVTEAAVESPSDPFSR